MVSVSRIYYLPRPSRFTAYIQSRFRSPDIELNTVNEILAHYGVTLTATPRNLPNTRRNRNLIINTSAGKKILKLYRKDWRTSTIVFEHSVLARLAQLSFPAPRLVSTTDGATYVNKSKNNYALFDFADGTNYSTSFLLRAHRLRLMAIAGQTMASLHRQLKGFLPEGQHHLGFKSYVDGRHRDMNWYREKVDELESKSLTLTDPQEIAIAKELIQQRIYVLDELSKLDQELSSAPLPRTIIHGDYGLHNILIQDSAKATPVDFELTRLEWRLSDLVSCLSRIRFATGEYDFESLQWFMDGYQTEFPFSDEEWDLFPQVWRHYKLKGAIGYWVSYFETGGPTRKLNSARDAIAQAKWALKHPDQLLSIRTKKT